MKNVVNLSLEHELFSILYREWAKKEFDEDYNLITQELISTTFIEIIKSALFLFAVIDVDDFTNEEMVEEYRFIEDVQDRLTVTMQEDYHIGKVKYLVGDSLMNIINSLIFDNEQIIKTLFKILIKNKQVTTIMVDGKEYDLGD